MDLEEREAVGFLLQPTWYEERGRPVVHLFGVDAEGKSFVLRDDRPRPHFFVAAEDAERAEGILRRDASGLPAFRLEASPFRGTDGRAVQALFVPLPRDAPVVRDRLHENGLKTYEADVPYATRYLIDQKLCSAFSIRGPARAGRRVDRIWFRPELSAVRFAPALRVLSLDIETDGRGEQVFSIALSGADRAGGGRTNEVLVWTPGLAFESETEFYLEVEGARTVVRPYATEKGMHQAFARRMRELDPDVLTGWNVIDFDLAVLARAAERFRLPFDLGRADLPGRLRLERGVWGSSRAILPGRVVLDGLQLLRDAFIRLPDYRLETAAQVVLGRGKTLASHGQDRVAEIERLWRQDLRAFVRYNLTDARLVLEILEQKRLVELAVERSLLTGMPLDRVSASIASFDFLYLTELHARGLVAPSVEPDQPGAWTQGGTVLESEPGLYRQVAVLDYRSLYPNLIRTFRLDPLSLVPPDASPAETPTESTEDLVRAPNGARFRRGGGILPELLDRLFPAREAALARGDELAATAIKILMNSFYGVLASTRCRFYSPETANAITGFGQEILHWTEDALERRGRRVLYGDTDSLFVALVGGTREQAEEEARTLVREVNDELAERLRERYRAESRLTLRFDRLFDVLFLPGLRHSNQGSKKRYAGLDGGRLHIVGLEAVRRDWTELAKRFQIELLERVLRGEPVEAFVRARVAELRAGEWDTGLVYRKALSKSEAEYGAGAPPHVQAARRRTQSSGRLVRYVMTTEGPEPEDEVRHPVDYEHYVEKQLRPIAEAILPHVGASWTDLTTRQGRLPL